jgi:hypothetical protein
VGSRIIPYTRNRKSNSISIDGVTDKSAERARKGLGLVALIALLTALILGFSSTFSYGTVKQLASNLSGHDQANRVTVAFFAQLKPVAKLGQLHTRSLRQQILPTALAAAS